MKKTTIIIFLFLSVFTGRTHAQALDKILQVEYKSGFAILNSGDTLLGNFEFNDCKQNYRLLVFLNPETGRKNAYNPQEVEIFGFDEMYYRPVELDDEWVFMRVLLEDKLKFYMYKNFYSTMTHTGIKAEFYLIKPNGETLLVSLDNYYPFEKRVGDFVRDCPELFQKIKDHVYDRGNIIAIVNEYNECLKNKKD